MVFKKNVKFSTLQHNYQHFVLFDVDDTATTRYNYALVNNTYTLTTAAILGNQTELKFKLERLATTSSFLLSSSAESTCGFTTNRPHTAHSSKST